jgi:integrase
MDKDELLRGLTEIATICSRLLNEVCKEPPKVIEEMGKLIYVDFHAANLHSLRHTFLSLCYLAGVKPKFMQVIAGHSKFEMTMNVYTHMLKKGKSHILTYIRKLAAYIEDNYI